MAKAQEQLDKLAEGYRKALQVLFEAELREVRQHVAEQADFFKGEIREALKLEQAEQTRNTAQIRRMQIAVLKWQFDYLRDAQQKAEEYAARRRVAALDGCDPFEEFEADDDEGLDEEGELTDDAVLMVQQLISGVPALRQRLANESMRAKLVKEGLKRSLLRRLKGQEEAEALDRCRHVVDEIHERLPAQPQDAREFLLKVEAAVPVSSEVIRMYEEHLAEHGVLAALATAGRPPLQEGTPSAASPRSPRSPRSPPGSPRRGGGGGGVGRRRGRGLG